MQEKNTEKIQILEEKKINENARKIEEKLFDIMSNLESVELSKRSDSKYILSMTKEDYKNEIAISLKYILSKLLYNVNVENRKEVLLRVIRNTGLRSSKLSICENTAGESMIVLNDEELMKSLFRLQKEVNVGINQNNEWLNRSEKFKKHMLFKQEELTSFEMLENKLYATIFNYNAGGIKSKNPDEMKSMTFEKYRELSSISIDKVKTFPFIQRLPKQEQILFIKELIKKYNINNNGRFAITTSKDGKIMLSINSAVLYNRMLENKNSNIKNIENQKELKAN